MSVRTSVTSNSDDLRLNRVSVALKHRRNKHPHVKYEFTIYRRIFAALLRDFERPEFPNPLTDILAPFSQTRAIAIWRTRSQRKPAAVRNSKVGLIHFSHHRASSAPSGLAPATWNSCITLSPNHTRILVSQLSCIPDLCHVGATRLNQPVQFRTLHARQY